MLNSKFSLCVLLLGVLVSGGFDAKLEARQLVDPPRQEERQPQSEETAPDIAKGKKDWIKTKFVRPTQTDVGRENVRTTYQGMMTESGGCDNLLAYFKDRFEGKPLPVVRGPDGQYYLTDGHHRTTATEELYHDCHLGEPKINVTIIEDYKTNGKSWDEFADFMDKNNKNYFAQDVRDKARAENGEIDPMPRVMMEKYLPKTFAALADNPGRSAVGNVMHAYEDAAGCVRQPPSCKKVPFNSERLREFFEFKVWDILRSKPFKIMLPEHYGEDAEKKKLADKQIAAALYTMPGVLKDMWRRIVSQDDPLEKEKLEGRNKGEAERMVNFMQAEYERTNIMPAVTPQAERPNEPPGVPAPVTAAPPR